VVRVRPGRSYPSGHFGLSGSTAARAKPDRNGVLNLEKAHREKKQ
jgi:hypothetical protein